MIWSRILWTAGLLLLGAANAWAETAPLEERTVLRKLLENNSEIRRAIFDLEIAAAQVLSAEGDFDTAFSITPAVQRSTLLSSSQTQDPMWIEKSNGVGAALKRKFGVGTEAELSFQALFLGSNSSQAYSAKRYQSGAGFKLSQPLLSGGWTAANLAEKRKAETQLQKYRANVLETTERILEKGLGFFWSCRAAGVEVQAREQELKAATEAREATTARLRAGLATPIDLLHAQAAQALAEAKLMGAEAELETTRERLARELLPPGSTDLAIGLSAATGGPALSFPKAAPAPVPGLEKAAADVQKAEIELSEALATRLPRLDLKAEGSAVGLGISSKKSFSKLTSLAAPSYSIGVEFSLPIPLSSSRGLVQSRRAARDQAETKYQQTLLGTRSDLALTLKQLETSRKSRQLLAERLQGESEKTEALRRFFLSGRIPNSKYLEQQTLLADLQVEAAREEINFKKLELHSVLLAGGHRNQEDVAQFFKNYLNF